MGILQVVVGGQLGSEAKGAVCGHLLRRYKQSLPDGPVMSIRVGGPNAGHTIWSYDAWGKPDVEWKLRHVPIAAVVDRSAILALAAGSEVNLDVVDEEMSKLDAAGLLNGRKLQIDPAATLLGLEHIEMETDGALTARLGSTGKGIGAARSERIWRRAATVGQVAHEDHPAWQYIELADVAEMANRLLINTHGLVQIEGVQGYGLGLHTEFYPYATSSDCRAIDFLAMAGISPWAFDLDDLEVWVVARTNPIRVAGNSGPLRFETSWEQLGLPQERTTVTNKVRRVGEWDGELVAKALVANGWPSDNVQLAITMLDQLFPDDTGEVKQHELTPEAQDWLNDRAEELGVFPSLVTTSPHSAVWLNRFVGGLLASESN